MVEALVANQVVEEDMVENLEEEEEEDTVENQEVEEDLGDMEAAQGVDMEEVPEEDMEAALEEALEDMVEAQAVAVMVVAPEEEADTVEAVVGFKELLWLE